MHQRVLARLSREPVTRADIDLVDNSLRHALAARDAVLDDDHDVDLLHPARTLLILMDDALVSDATLLAAAAGLESERGDFAGRAAAPGLPHAIPTPLTTNPDALVEGLVGLPRELLDAALAERLDHARHLHLRPESAWAAGYRLERDVYLPVAARHGGPLARRYERWQRAFRARTGW